jgi:hypothetical protein
MVVAGWKTQAGAHRRRLRCRGCGNRWSHVAEDATRWARQRRPDARLTESQVVEALTSPVPGRVLAERFGVSVSAINAIRRRRVYRWIRPDLPPWTKPQRPRKPKPAPAPRAARQSCATCRWWDHERRKCRQGWPDPETDGVRYGADCIDYEPLKESK